MLTNTFKFTLPILPTLLSAWILNLSDRIFIDKYFNMSDVGIYSLGSKISGSVLILFGAFILAYSPYFYEKAKSQDNLRIYLHLISKFVWFFCLYPFHYFSFRRSD